MELNSNLNDTILQQKTLEDSDSMNVKQNCVLDPSINSNKNPIESEQNNKDEVSYSAKDSEPKELTNQDILGSGDGVSNPSINSNEHLIESEQNNKDELSHSANDSEPKEETFQDILGSGDLLKKILRQGSLDERPMKGEQIVINLVGRLEDSNEIIEEKNNLEITLGDCEVIQGVDLALSLMNVGEIAILKIASRFGYGDKGLEPNVSPTAKLIYTVELLSIKSEIIPDDLTPIERLKIGLLKKDKGNWWYARNENTMALHVYRKALQYFGESEKTIDSDLEQNSIQIERVKTLNNMAAVYMSMNSLDLALQTLESVLKVEPMNEKAIMRKGKVLALKGQNMAAARELKKALQINPNNKTVQNLLSNAEAALVKERAQERELYKKMLGQKDHNKKATKDAKKTNTTFIISGLVAGIAVVCGYCYLNNNFPFSKFSTF